MLKYDDSLDVFGVHGVGGIVGAIGTAIVAAPALGGFGPGGAEYAIGGQLGTQVTAVVIAIVWSAVVSAIALYIVKAVMGLRPTEAEEREGLDITTHGERAYN
jgi:Amt family ammonium transporter